MDNPPQTWAASTKFAPSAGKVSRALGRITSLGATGRFLQRELWAWPIIAAIVISAVGWWVRGNLEAVMKGRIAGALTTILDADVAALNGWINHQKENSLLLADKTRLRPIVEELIKISKKEQRLERELAQSSAQTAIRTLLADRLERLGYVGFFVVSPSSVVLAADDDSPIGKTLTGYRKEFFDGVLVGSPSVSKPFRSTLLLADAKGELKANLPSMYTAAPVHDESGKPIAVLALRIRPEQDFTRILQVAQSGESGETYAFDENGLLLSQSRFDDHLKRVGLLADLPDSGSILTLELRDPGVNMLDGERPSLARAEQPLTRMAADAVAGNNGIDVEGYRDYRGVPVVGAWKWLPEYNFGVATEIDVAEAYEPVFVLRRGFWMLIGLAVVSAVFVFAYMRVASRQQFELQKAVLEAKRLGQYSLEEKIGSGGMGTVYRARHAMLRRPTAVKILNPESLNKETAARFEREVQLTSNLTHPNTIAIYDYGRTPEGLFYYAMEYLEGINLEELVAKEGPLPDGRALFILRQIAGSLAEAHAAGLVHRDIKPANVLLTCRGGICDFAKVLDFGLVKPVVGSQEAGITAAGAATGTPLYMSPEAISEPGTIDARTDVYSIGAVAYYLLTGAPVFSGATIVEICMKHLNQSPGPPSRRTANSISETLDELIVQCLAKDRYQRPSNAGVLLQHLEECIPVNAWSSNEAASWWFNRDNETSIAPQFAQETPPLTTTLKATWT